MAPTSEALDPSLLQFIERMLDKGLFPALVLVGLFYLVMRFGWPWQGHEPPPPPSSAQQPDKAVVEALEDLTEKFDTFRLEVVQRLTRVETKINLPRRPKGDE